MAHARREPDTGGLTIRHAGPSDLDAVARMRAALWTDTTLEEHAREAAPLLAGRTPGTLPLTVFIAERDGAAVGFVEVGLRSHADGCDPSRPVGFIEGWYVEPAARRQGVGAALIARAEEWARGHGCLELASDTWITNLASQLAHEALGFEVVDRCVNYRKPIRGGGDGGS